MFTYDDASHTYTLNGKIIPSVTQVLSRVSVNGKSLSGYCDIGNEVSENAKQFGRVVHKCAELVIKKKEFTFQEEVRPWVNAVSSFMNHHSRDLEIIETETPWFSALYRYGTTPDVFGYYKGTPILIDWKTSEGSVKAHKYQLAAQEQVMREKYKIPASKKFLRWIVKLLPDKYETDQYSDKNDFNVFLSALNIYKTFS